VGCNREDRDLISIGAVAPENPIGAGSAILCVCFEYFLILIVGMGQRMILVGFKARMARVSREKLDAFEDLFEEALGLGGFPFALAMTRRGFGVSHKIVERLAGACLPD